jgi:rhodanese-related sulfurtransferase/DNA-binding transcriptional ArsR family regulator
VASQLDARDNNSVIYIFMDKVSEERLDLYGQLARIGKVVMHPKRIELLELLCQGERTVEALAQASGLKLTTASAHLQLMRQGRLVVTRREGVRVYYRAAGEEVCRFVAALGELARARLAEVDQILRDIGADEHATERVTRAELLRRVRAGEVVVIDVRPIEEYEAGHIPGALSVPLEHLETRLEEIDRAVDVVAYCRGPLCLLAPQAVATLRRRGHEAHCLQDGMPEWRQAGLPVAVGAEASSGPSRRRPSRRKTTPPRAASTGAKTINRI